MSDDSSASPLSTPGGGPPSSRREKILAAALELFGAQGYAFTTVEALCAVAGVSERHFYQEFDGREELLAALYERCSEWVRQRFERGLAAIPGDADLVGVANAALRAHLEAILDDPRVGRIFSVETPQATTQLTRRTSQEREAFGALIEARLEAAVAQGLLPERSYRSHGIFLAGGVDALVIRALAEDAAPSVDALHGVLLGVFAAYLRGLGSASPP